MIVNAWKWPVLFFENLIKNYQYMYTYLVGDIEAIHREVVCVHLLESFFEGHASLNFHLVRITTVIEISAYCFTEAKRSLPQNSGIQVYIHINSKIQKLCSKIIDVNIL